jgi:hypothetical protein
MSPEGRGNFFPELGYHGSLAQQLFRQNIDQADI